MNYNYSNKEINASLKEQGFLFRRKGSCKDCNGKCCNFTSLASNGRNYDKWHASESLKDKWIKNWWHMVTYIRCAKCTLAGKCAVFNSKKMPVVCAQFPSSPADGVYRVLMMKKTPCGFYFVDAKTGKKWDMRRKKYTVKKMKETKPKGL